MPESGAKITISAEALQAINEFNKLNAAVKRTTDQTSGIGRELDKIPGAFAKSLIGAGALLGIVKSIAEQTAALRRESEAASKSVGGRLVRSELAARRLGLSSGDAAALTTSTGARSSDELTGFLTSLADSGGKRGVKVDRKAVFEGVAALQIGTVTEAEAIEAIRRNGTGKLRDLAASRYNGLSQEAKDEIGLQSFENQKADESAGSAAARGGGARRTTATLRAEDARNPAGAIGRNLLNNLPFAEEYGRAIVEGRDGEHGGYRRPTGGTQRDWKTLGRIAENTAPKPPRPTLAPQVDPP